MTTANGPSGQGTAKGSSSVSKAGPVSKTGPLKPGSGSKTGPSTKAGTATKPGPFAQRDETGSNSALATSTRLIPKVRSGSAPGIGRTKFRIGAQPGHPAAPGPGASHGTYVADSFTGDLTATMGGSPALAHDGEPAGLARVTLAMRPTARREPAPRQLVGLALWAAALGILGSILAIRDAVGIFLGAPSWFMPIVSIVGVAGIGLTMGAFLTARARILPWTLLGVATCALGGAFLATLLAF